MFNADNGYNSEVFGAWTKNQTTGGTNPRNPSSSYTINPTNITYQAYIECGAANGTGYIYVPFTVTNAINISNYRKLIVKGNVALAVNLYTHGTVAIRLESASTGTITTLQTLSTGDNNLEIDISEYTGNYKLQVYLTADKFQYAGSETLTFTMTEMYLE